MHCACLRDNDKRPDKDEHPDPHNTSSDFLHRDDCDVIPRHPATNATIAAHARDVPDECDVPRRPWHILDVPRHPVVPDDRDVPNVPDDGDSIVRDDQDVPRRRPATTFPAATIQSKLIVSIYN